MYTAICAAAIVFIAAVLLAIRYMQVKRNRAPRGFVLIPVLADDGLFERRVRACYWEEAFADPRYAKDILLVIIGPCANAFTARRLAQELANVHAVHVSSLSDYMIRNYEEFRGS